MKATLANNKQTPRKTRLVTDMIKGKKVSEALSILKFSPQRSTESIAKLIASAVANATTKGADKDSLYIKSITVNKGLVMKRFMPRARGSASRINRRFSHLKVELGTK